ncbi:MAG TPA: type II secretion system protein [Leptospiraceae bacterium]|nr:type II secretion system protein [Leptospiraceae bacterium]HMW08251.1 type II secretion system protein [Leptospiraceae bacterium]HMX35078.1 type II secretion system protein [Leptospiraceae bacterium]HMY34017.1 type II secretion system protein [Leptospiraceae bacterium]HMZ66329.1 type II secretion system protein [Leptospiraceae bacterium]
MKVRRGMTLVEIVVVVSILGLLMALMVSSVSSLIRPSSKDTADKIKAGLYYAYQTAIISNNTVLFDIDMEKNKFTAAKLIRSEEGLKEKKVLEVALPSHNKIVNVTDLRGVKYETGHLIIPFTHDGVAGDYNIHIGEDANNIYKSILLYRYNGKIVVKNGEVNRSSGAGQDNTQRIKMDADEDK